MSKTILITGGTGNVGRALAETLRAAGASVRVGSRRPEAGATRFDYKDKATYAAALADVDRLYAVVPTGELDPVGTVGPFLAEAAARGVKIVLQTAIGVDADDHIPLRVLEKQVEASGVPYVILRPNWFIDNFVNYWGKGIVDRGLIAVPAGDAATSFIDARDIADVAAGVLRSSQFDGQALILTGGEALSYGDAAKVLSDASGRSIRYEASDDDTLVTQLSALGVPEAYGRMLATIFYPVRQGWTAGVSPAVEAVTGKAPRKLATYARENAAAWQG